MRVGKKAFGAGDVWGVRCVSVGRSSFYFGAVVSGWVASDSDMHALIKEGCVVDM